MTSTACSPGCRWLVRVLRFGRARNSWRIERQLGPELCAHLEGALVGFNRIDGRLVHGPHGWPTRIVGFVTAARADAHQVLAELQLLDDVPDVRAGLRALEAAGRLTRMGVSWVGHVVWDPPAGAAVRTVQRVVDVQSVDFVLSPAADGACVLRSLPCAPLAVPETGLRAAGAVS